jgi:transposase
VAKHVTKITLGIDVAKDQLVVYHWQTEETCSVPNQPAEIRSWLKSFHQPLRIAIEPTSHYHTAMVEAVLAAGHEVYLVNPRQLVHYRQAINERHKTDPLDARLLARYLEREANRLRPYQPQDRKAQRLWGLLSRRATVVQSRQRLQMSFTETGISIRAVVRQLNQLILRLDRTLLRLIRELGWWSHYQSCLSIPGIGPANAVALTAAYHRGAFAGSDAFVAYLGLDVRIRESGCYKGKRKLTKRGEPELRRLLYCAANGARCYSRFAEYHQRQLDKGLSKIAARIVLARKLVRIAFTLMVRQETFVKEEKTACLSP